MDFEIEKDGIDHVNVFSKSRTMLGRLLSNFAHTPITVNDIGFESIESWWYWKKMNKANELSLFPVFTQEQMDEVRSLVGKEAKSYFRKLFKGNSSAFSPEKSDLKEVYLQKLTEHPEIKKMLLSNKLPLGHYYVMFEKKVSADSTMWIAKLWEEIAEELRK